MKRRTSLLLTVAAVALGALLLSSPTHLSAQQSAPAGVTVGDSDLGGVVTSANGPEAGVWVIAETHDLPTKFVKIVVTDDQGRYVLPELPKANYDVWVRGYGLVDSPKVKSAPGQASSISPRLVAPNEAAAAEYYPAQYWYSMLEIPDKSLFPGTGPNGNGMPEQIKSQGQWIATLKTHGCNSCHQVGNKPTRTISKALGDVRFILRSLDAPPAGRARGREHGARHRRARHAARSCKQFADWTDRIAAGELPKSKPQRPQGVERNVVVTLWDWGDAKTYLHDEIATDKRNPTVNAWGPIYSATEDSTDNLPILDPKTHSVTYLKSTPRDR